MQTVRVTKFVLIETGTYNDMFQRPFTSHIDGDIIDEFRDLSMNGMQTSASGVAGLAGRIIAPSTVAGDGVNIVGGWGSRRLRFLIEFELANQSIITREVVNGYTDYVGANPSGAIDPEMRMFFNNTTTLRTVKVDRGHGFSTQTSITDASQVVTRPMGQTDYNAFQTTQARTMRPEDVVATMGISALPDTSGLEVFDNRTVLLNDPKKSARSNVIPSNYLAKVVRGLETSRITNDTQYGAGDYNRIYEEARNNVRDSVFSKDKIMRMLHQNTEFTLVGSVSYREMCRVFPDLDFNAGVIFKGQMQKIDNATGLPTPERGDSQGWGGTSLEHNLANVLGNAIPALMTELMLAKMAFSVTNRTTDGRFATIVNDARSLATVGSVKPYVETFVQRFEAEVLFDLTRGNQYDIAIHGYVDVVGDTFFSISINGGYEVSFTMPSFCDSLMTPIMAMSTDPINNMAYNIETLWNDSVSSTGYLNAPSQMEPQSITHQMHDYNPGTTRDIPQYTTPNHRGW